MRARETFISYYALTRNGGTTDDSGRHFGCYKQDHSNLLRRLATSGPHEFLSERSELFLAAKRPRERRSNERSTCLAWVVAICVSRQTLKHGEKHYPHLEFQVAFSRVPDFNGGMYWFHSDKNNRMRVFLSHRKVKFIYFVLKLSQRFQLSAHFRSWYQRAKESQQQKRPVCSAWCSPFDRQFHHAAVKQRCNDTRGFRGFSGGS